MGRASRRAAVEPCIRIWNFVNAPVLIGGEGLVFAAIKQLLMSDAVNVALPAVLGVTEKVFVPTTRAALAASVVLASLEVMPTTSVELTRFQLASTALAVRVNEPPAV